MVYVVLDLYTKTIYNFFKIGNFKFPRQGDLMESKNKLDY